MSQINRWYTENMEEDLRKAFEDLESDARRLGGRLWRRRQGKTG